MGMEKTLCYNSLAYCCGLEKPCPFRDKTIKELGLTKKDFLKLKKQFDKNLLELIELKGGKRK